MIGAPFLGHFHTCGWPMASVSSEGSGLGFVFTHACVTDREKDEGD